MSWRREVDRQWVHRGIAEGGVYGSTGCSRRGNFVYRGLEESGSSLPGNPTRRVSRTRNVGLDSLEFRVDPVDPVQYVGGIVGDIFLLVFFKMGGISQRHS